MTVKTMPSLPEPPSVADRIAAGELDATEDFFTYPSSSLPLAVARRLVADLFTTGEHKTLAFWRGDFWSWNGPSWTHIEDDLDVKGPLWGHLEKVTVKGDKEGDVKPWAPTTAKIQNLMEPLAYLTRIDGRSDAPMWVNDGPHPPARRVISLQNGLLDLNTRTITTHTPGFFNTWALNFNYDVSATCPTWERFLDDIFSHDPAGKDFLQELFGMFISGRTDHHKAGMIIGPPRAGKGIISRTVKQLIGVDNTVSPSLHTLGADFGLEGLIGKPLAIIEDARADGAQRNNLAVERLLNIIGEDAVSINRKGISYWNGTLPTRFLLVSNEIPRFLDSSGAITNRFMVVKLHKSYADNPDTTLGHRINQELSGIFNWALRGLDRLDRQGHFTRPGTMDEMLDLMGDLASPVKKFLDENYIVTGDQDDRIETSEVHTRFKSWCVDQELGTMNRDTFTQRLVAADPAISYKNTVLPGHKKKQWFFGLKDNLNAFHTST